MARHFSDSATSTSPSMDKPIGDIIREANNLAPDQIEKIAAHQRQTGLKFGEAAVALGFVKRENVLWALSQQFHYPYARQTKLPSELVVSHSPFSKHAETFRNMRTRLINTVFKPGAAPRALAVVSPDVGDGKTYFAANMALVFSQLGGRTLLVDADLRTPRLHEMLGVNTTSGLSNVLIGRAQVNVLRPVDELPNFYFLPVGVAPPNPLELVQRASFAQLMLELHQKFDYIIVDTPAAAHGADAHVIASVCGAAALVGRREVSRVHAMKDMADTVTSMGAMMAGVVIND